MVSERVGSKIVQPEVMEVIQEQLICLETLIGHEKEGQERSIIDCLKEVMENAERAKSLHISFVAKSSE